MKLPLLLMTFSVMLISSVQVTPARQLQTGGPYGSSSSGQQQNLNRSQSRCVSGSDCGVKECSVMGMQRYSEPRCHKLGDVGSPCRPFNEPDNKTLHFPHTTMHCTNVYTLFCPCAMGLVCRQGECVRDSNANSYGGRSQQSSSNRGQTGVRWAEFSHRDLSIDELDSFS